MLLDGGAVFRDALSHLVQFGELFDLAFLEGLHQLVDGLPNFGLDLEPLELGEAFLEFIFFFIFVLDGLHLLLLL